MRIASKALAETVVKFTTETSGKKLEQAVEVFIDFLKSHRLIRQLPEIIRLIDCAWKKRFGVSAIAIETAHPLSEHLRAQLIQLSRGAAIVESVNPELIGGSRIRLDDRLLDGTILGRMEQLRKHLMYGNEK